MQHGITPEQRLAILKDYRRKNAQGDHRHTGQWVADKHGVSLATVNALRLGAGTARNGGSPLPRLWVCPFCGFRALTPEGHGLCLGDASLIEWEAERALQVVSQVADLEQEVA